MSAVCQTLPVLRSVWFRCKRGTDSFPRIEEEGRKDPATPEFFLLRQQQVRGMETDFFFLIPVSVGLAFKCLWD